MKIKKIEYLDDYDEFVYSLNVEDNHNFYLQNGVLSKNCLMVLDEAQNCTWKTLMLFVTRMGKGSKVIIMGDVTQYDIKKDMIALQQFSEEMGSIAGVGVFHFEREDIMRDKILIDITDRYEKLKYGGSLKEEKR